MALVVLSALNTVLQLTVVVGCLVIALCIVLDALGSKESD